MTAARGEVTRLLGAAEAGDPEAKHRLLAVAYDELRDLAANLMRSERTDHTLQPTALVNEAAMRLLNDQAPLHGTSRAWFFGAMAQAMRRVLIDHARKRNAQRRCGSWSRTPLDTVVEQMETAHGVDLVDLDASLKQLEALNERQSAVVERRFFGGCDMPEIAAQLGVSLSTVENDWRIARAWLRQQLAEGTP